MIEIKKRTLMRPFFYELACKPGSVANDHLSRPMVAHWLKPPPESGRASLLLSHGVAPDRVYSTDMSPCGGWALTPPFHLFPAKIRKVVYFCCTCPRVTPGGRYPLSLPCGARTFLMYRLSPCTRGRSANSQAVLYPFEGTKSIKFLVMKRGKIYND